MEYNISKTVMFGKCSIVPTSNTEFIYTLKRKVSTEQIQDASTYVDKDELVVANMFQDFINYNGTIQCGSIKRTGDVFIDPNTFAPLVTLEVEFNLIQG